MSDCPSAYAVKNAGELMKHIENTRMLSMSQMKLMKQIWKLINERTGGSDAAKV